MALKKYKESKLKEIHFNADGAGKSSDDEGVCLTSLHTDAAAVHRQEMVMISLTEHPLQHVVASTLATHVGLRSKL